MKDKIKGTTETKKETEESEQKPTTPLVRKH